MQRHSAVLAWLTAGALGMAFSWWAYPRVFPEASIDLKITPRQAEQIGRDALRQLRPDLDLSGWRSAVEFDWDNNAKFYLEKTLGLAQANAIMREQVSVWRPNRRDHAFVYEHRTRKYPADSPTPATLRLTISVLGDAVGSYSLNWLHTPEKWAFEQRQRESLRTTLGFIFGGIDTAFQLVAIGTPVCFWLARRVLQGNLFAWANAFLLSFVVGMAGTYLNIPNPTLRWNGWILLGVYGVLLAASYRVARRMSAPASEAVVEGAPATVLTDYALVQMETPQPQPERGEG